MTEMQNYMEIDPETGEKSYGALPVGVDLPEGAIAVAAQPSRAFEAHSITGAEAEVDYAALADAHAGPQAKAEAHLIKSMEARLILAGVQIEGMLAAEAALLNVPVEQLAQIICTKSQQQIDAELLRRTIKLGINRKE